MRKSSRPKPSFWRCWRAGLPGSGPVTVTWCSRAPWSTWTREGVATVEQVLGGQQLAAPQPGVDAGRGLGVVGGGRSGGHIRDHVGPISGADLSECVTNPFQRVICPRRA